MGEELKNQKDQCERQEKRDIAGLCNQETQQTLNMIHTEIPRHRKENTERQILQNSKTEWLVAYKGAPFSQQLTFHKK